MQYATIIAAVLCLSVRTAADADFALLNNGLHFPKVSFGLQVYSDDTAEQLTKIAIDAGIRNFFSSVLAGNQVGFGRGVQDAR